MCLLTCFRIVEQPTDISTLITFQGGWAVAKSEYVLPKPDTVSMSITAAERLIASGNGDAALLYIHT